MAALPWLWIPITIFAAFVQNIRSAAQKHLTSELTTISVTMVRFLFGLPFGLLYVWFLHSRTSEAFPEISGSFIAMTALAGASQIMGTALLVYLFSLRNFAVGTTYARTEAFLTAILGALVFGEVVVISGWAAILVSVIGVIMITVAKTGLRGGQLLTLLFDKAAWIGVASGLAFAMASLSMRKASLILGVDDFLYRAGLTMIAMLTMQTVVMCLYVLVTNPGQYRIIWNNRKVCLLVGVSSVMGTIGWATAFTLEQAAYVKSLAQVEFVFTLAASYWFFKERSTPRELCGIALVITGIILLVLFG
ncbi:MAG: DMT family transporter [Rickettsiales bacterium]